MQALRWTGQQCRRYSGGAKAETVGNRFATLWWRFEKESGVREVELIKRWQSEGNDFSKAILRLLLGKLRKVGRYDEATKILKWTVDTKPFELTSREYLMRIQRATRERKLTLAKRIFDGMPCSFKNSELYTALLKGYASQRQAEKAERIMEAFVPTTAEAYNLLALMYLRMGLDADAGRVMGKLQASSTALDELSIYILVRYRSRLSADLQRTDAEDILAETTKNLRYKKDRFQSARYTMLAYSYMNKLAGVEEVWRIIQSEATVLQSCCAAAIEAFAIAGDVKKGEAAAERINKKKRSEKDFYPSLVFLYARNGLLEKAAGIIDDMNARNLRTTYACYDELITGCIEQGQTDMAISKLHEAYEKVRVNSRLSYDTVLLLLPVYEEEQDVKGAEQLCNVYKGWKDVRMFNRLLKVYLRAGKQAAGFPARLRSAEVAPDAETLKLLRLAGSESEDDGRLRQRQD